MVEFLIKNLSFSYPGSEKYALKNIDLTINSGEFIVISGKSGSGKSTLLRMLKPELSPKGKISGEIYFFGKEKDSLSLYESAEKIGYILQNPEYQTVTHTVQTELSFGLENLGIESDAMRLRIAEISAYFSLEKIMDKKVSELSGGQKQLLCLAGILAMHPKAVIFDEPTSQLDPMAAETFLQTVNKLCRENGITVIISEHRLENIIPLSDRLIVLDKGKIISDSHPKMLSPALFRENDFINSSMPAPMRILSHFSEISPLPLTVSEGRAALGRLLGNKTAATEKTKITDRKTEEYAVEASGVWFSYDKKRYVLNDFSMKIPKGCFYALLGANAAGKTTAISLMSGLLPLKTGKIKILGQDIKKYKTSELFGQTVAVLPQKCESLFSCNTLEEELKNAVSTPGLSKEEQKRRVAETAELTEITELLSRHPYDISGGEMQRAALALILLKKPQIIFMDEPTKGTDALFKKKYASIIKNLCDSGITVIAVSHDTEFCAEYSDRCAFIFDGRCITDTEPKRFFSENFFYTTASNKTARDFFPTAVTEREVVELCEKSLLC